MDLLDDDDFLDSLLADADTEFDGVRCTESEENKEPESTSNENIPDEVKGNNFKAIVDKDNV